MSTLLFDGIDQKGMPLGVFAARTGIRLHHAQRLCREGKINGARQHVLTKKWWIYPPAKLLCGKRPKHVDTSTPMHSTLLDGAQA